MSEKQPTIKRYLDQRCIGYSADWQTTYLRVRFLDLDETEHLGYEARSSTTGIPMSYSVKRPVMAHDLERDNA